MLGRIVSKFASQMGVVVIAWQVYEKTNSALALGFVGLAGFVASALLVFIGGHSADRYDRKRITQACLIGDCIIAAVLAAGSFGGWLSVADLFAAIMALGASSAFDGPATQALLAGVAPPGLLPQAAAATSAANEVAVISGPALGGLLFAMDAGVPYAIMGVLWLVAAVLIGTIALERPVAAAKQPPTLAALFAGVGFIWRSPALLGTMSLDLVAVLLGGATALMPIYARDILHTDAFGLGVLRGAPAIGALLMASFLSQRTIARRAGMRMFQAVLVFGVATVVFSLSRSMILSIGALVVMGAADTISRVIRNSLVQLATPDAMRGRVSAVKSLFVGASNELGEFESGVTAALVGAMPAAVFGGVGTIVVALLWMKLFPALRDLQSLD